jgi:hypothetical protein
MEPASHDELDEIIADLMNDAGPSSLRVHHRGQVYEPGELHPDRDPLEEAMTAAAAMPTIRNADGTKRPVVVRSRDPSIWFVPNNSEYDSVVDLSEFTVRWSYDPDRKEKR